MSRPDCSPKGLARAALEREQPAKSSVPRPPSGTELDLAPLRDGRVGLVDRRAGQLVGIAVNQAQADRTRKFFQ